MPRRRGWNGSPPENDEQARQILLAAARDCIDRRGVAHTSLGDVAQEAGVTRQTVYRYFQDTDDLFRSAAVLASGGFLERLRQRVHRQHSLKHRIAECVVFAVSEIPKDAYLGALASSEAAAQLPFLLTLRFVREEILHLSKGDPGLSARQLDELAEFLLRLLISLLQEPGPARSTAQLRTLIRSWTTPVLDSYRR